MLGGTKLMCLTSGVLRFFIGRDSQSIKAKNQISIFLNVISCHLPTTSLMEEYFQY